MEKISRLQITPGKKARCTPLELLQDFADSSFEWHCLEKDSMHYAKAKKAPAGVLRYSTPQADHEADLAFVADESQEHTTFHLAVVTPSHEDTPFSPKHRQEKIARFEESFRSYLSERNTRNQLNVSKRAAGA